MKVYLPHNREKGLRKVGTLHTVDYKGIAKEPIKKSENSKSCMDSLCEMFESSIEKKKKMREKNSCTIHNITMDKMEFSKRVNSFCGPVRLHQQRVWSFWDISLFAQDSQEANSDRWEREKELEIKKYSKNSGLRLAHLFVFLLISWSPVFSPYIRHISTIGGLAKYDITSSPCAPVSRIHTLRWLIVKFPVEISHACENLNYFQRGNWSALTDVTQMHLGREKKLPAIAKNGKFIFAIASHSHTNRVKKCKKIRTTQLSRLFLPNWT